MGGHDPADDVDQFRPVLKMARPGRYLETGIVGRLEKRQAANVIEMGVGEQQVEGPRVALADFHAQIACARTAIDQDKRVACPDFETGGFPPYRSVLDPGVGVDPLTPQQRSENSSVTCYSSAGAGATARIGQIPGCAL